MTTVSVEYCGTTGWQCDLESADAGKDDRDAEFEMRLFVDKDDLDTMQTLGCGGSFREFDVLEVERVLLLGHPLGVPGVKSLGVTLAQEHSFVFKVRSVFGARDAIGR